MATNQRVVSNNGRQAIILNSNEQVFLWNRRSAKGLMDNAAGIAVEYQEGLVLGRIGTTGKLVPCASGASDGSQYPCGVLIGGVTLGASTTSNNVWMCDDGDVAEEKLYFLSPSDTLNTAVSSVQMRDLLKRVGIKCIAATELTGYDNF